MSRREIIDTGADERYVRRVDDGKFKESVDVGRSLSAVGATEPTMPCLAMATAATTKPSTDHR